MTKRRVNKARLIREVLNNLGYDARPKQVIEVLAARKITVSSAQVSNIKAAHRKGECKQASADESSEMVSIALLRQAKVFVNLAKSHDEAKRILDVVSLFA